MASVVRQRGALAAGAVVAGVAAASSADNSAVECYSQPLPSPESITQAVELLKPGNEVPPGKLVTSVNADGRAFHDVDYDLPDEEMLHFFAAVKSAAADPAVIGALAANRRKQPVVDRMMLDQSTITCKHPNAGLEQESVVLVDSDYSVQSVSSSGNLSESLLLEANEELRAENAMLRQENAALKAQETAALKAQETAALKAQGSGVMGPVRTRINISDGRCCVTLRLRQPSAPSASPPDAEEPEWLEDAREALMKPVPLSAAAEAICRGSENAMPRETDEGAPAGPSPLREWEPALIVGAVVIVGTLALALSRNPKVVSVAVKKAAVAIRMLIATFRIPA